LASVVLLCSNHKPTFVLRLYRIRALVSDSKGGTYRLRVFESRVLSRVLGPKRYEVATGWKKLHNEELHNF
jgi:hypothetical protein